MKNIVFDLGKVLVDFEPLKYLNTLYAPEKVQLLHDTIFLSQEWLDLDRGTITNEEAIEIINSRCPSEKESIQHILYNWPQILTPIQGSIDILKTLKKQGYSLYLLSNFHKEAFNEVFKKYKFFENFDGKVVSYEVSLLKPEKKIYLHLCSTYNIKPEETLFIDDTLVNIIVAKELGFKTIHFRNPKQLMQALKYIKIIL